MSEANLYLPDSTPWLFCCFLLPSRYFPSCAFLFIPLLYFSVPCLASLRFASFSLLTCLAWLGFPSQARISEHGPEGFGTRGFKPHVEEVIVNGFKIGQEAISSRAKVGGCG